MCSFLFTDEKIDDFDYTNHYMKFRGPDHTNYVEVNDYIFAHNLLSITGDFTEQPFINYEDEIVCVYNGQIYNYSEFGEYKSDGECLIPLYQKYGDKFIQKLDGEFAIVLVDFKKNLFIISTDVFATKPLWYSIGSSISVASYESAVKSLRTRKRHDYVRSPSKLDANITRVYDLKTKNLVKELPVYEFDLRQYKTSFDDWNVAFENSIRKRAFGLRENIFIGLSSGYDSGSISCELNLSLIHI